MKFFQRLLILSTSILMVLSACQKEFTIEDELDPPVDPPTTVSGDYLDKLYITDSVGGVAGRDTNGIITYFYDAQKRVTMYTDSILEDNEWVVFKSAKYFYNWSHFHLHQQLPYP